MVAPKDGMPKKYVPKKRRERERKGLAVRPSTAGLLIDKEYSRVRDSAWIHLTSSVTTQIAVELVDVQGNYPTMLE